MFENQSIFNQEEQKSSNFIGSRIKQSVQQQPPRRNVQRALQPGHARQVKARGDCQPGSRKAKAQPTPFRTPTQQKKQQK